MSTGDKIARLRKEQNWTQEQFAQVMEVSRQSVSKWESDLAFPETEKLIKMSTLFHCSTDYLLKEEYEETEKTEHSEDSCQLFCFRSKGFEYRSKRTLCGVPLVHVNLGWNRTAKGVVAIGLKARGIVSLGLLSVGVCSFGLVSLGALSIGALAVGLLALGSIAIGLFAIGAVAVGILALGALAVGMVADGAGAFGHFLAIGDFAKGQIALGGETAEGILYEVSTGLSGQMADFDRTKVLELLAQQMTGIWTWLRQWAEALI